MNKENKITNSKELSVALLDALLQHKTETITYGDAARVIIHSASEFQDQALKNKDSQLNISKLSNYSPEALCQMLITGIATNIMASFVYKCSPEEAEAILARTEKAKPND